MTILSGVDTADFNFLLSTLALSKGNRSAHVDRLENAGYVEVLKSFSGKIPHAEYRLMPQGRRALLDYWATLDQIRGGGTERQ